MLSFDEVQEILTDIADHIPAAIYGELNGGVILLPEAKRHPKRIGDDLFIMGEYHVEPVGFGRYITIYYGSFAQVYSHLSREALRDKLEEVLHHELVHHLESLAGDHSLEIQDARDLERYSRRKGTANKQTNTPQNNPLLPRSGGNKKPSNTPHNNSPPPAKRGEIKS
jgi:predicted Zn-dependent protease with MMP-like domain